MMMLDVVRFVRVAQRHPDSLDFRLAEILEHERLDAGVGFDSLVKIATPAIGTQLACANDENVATNHFNPFHKSHLPYPEWPQVPGIQDKLFSTVASEWLMLKMPKVQVIS
jgi:hypothetical protein